VGKSSQKVYFEGKEGRETNLSGYPRRSCRVGTEEEVEERGRERFKGRRGRFSQVRYGVEVEESSELTELSRRKLFPTRRER